MRTPASSHDLPRLRQQPRLPRPRAPLDQQHAPVRRRPPTRISRASAASSASRSRSGGPCKPPTGFVWSGQYPAKNVIAGRSLQASEDQILHSGCAPHPRRGVLEQAASCIQISSQQHTRTAWRWSPTTARAARTRSCRPTTWRIARLFADARTASRRPRGALHGDGAGDARGALGRALRRAAVHRLLDAADPRGAGVHRR